MRNAMVSASALACMCAACGGSGTPSTPTTTPAVATTQAPACQLNNTAQVAFANHSTGATYAVVWDGVSRVTLGPGVTSPSYTEAAGIAHTLQFKYSGTNTLACSTSSPTLAQCSTNNTISCSTELKADIQSVGSGTYLCSVGLCTQFSYSITNAGLGCATNTHVITRFYGSDGNGPQLGIDVPMELSGQSLSAFHFKPGSTVTVVNTVSFNDIRSAHTVYKASITWDDERCQ